RERAGPLSRVKTVGLPVDEVVEEVDRPGDRAKDQERGRGPEPVRGVQQPLGEDERRDHDQVLEPLPGTQGPPDQPDRATAPGGLRGTGGGFAARCLRDRRRHGSCTNRTTYGMPVRRNSNPSTVIRSSPRSHASRTAGRTDSAGSNWPSSTKSGRTSRRYRSKRRSPVSGST